MTTVPVTQDTFIGRVKWFNNKSGFGFITLMGGEKEEDIFVHHSAIQVESEQYKYLVQGEYVEFELVKMTEGAHEFQAGNVCGIKGGKLMCVTRREFRETRTNYKSGDDNVEPNHPPPPTKLYTPKSVATPKVRGQGPREGSLPSGSTEWTYVAKKPRSQIDAPVRTRKPRVDKNM